MKNHSSIQRPRAVEVFPVSPPPVLETPTAELFSRVVVGAISAYLFCSCNALRSRFFTCSSARCFNSSRVKGFNSSSPLSSRSSASRRSSLIQQNSFQSFVSMVLLTYWEDAHAHEAGVQMVHHRLNSEHVHVMEYFVPNRKE